MSPHLLAVGDNVVDCYPDLGVMFPGGNAVNVAVHARRAGASSAYLGAVGTDPAGDLVRGSLVAEGVDDRPVTGRRPEQDAVDEQPRSAGTLGHRD